MVLVATVDSAKRTGKTGMRSSYGGLPLTALILTLLTSAAHGTTFVLMDEPQLLETSDVVVVGTVTAIESAQGPADGIQTYVHVQPSHVIKGGIGNDPLVLREPGGSFGERRAWVYGAPEFWVGERCLLFLTRNSDGTLQTNNLAMGKFTLEVDASGRTVATRDFGYGSSLLMPSAEATLIEAQPQRQRFAPLLNRLRALAQDATTSTSALPVLMPPELATTTTETKDAFTFLGSPPSRWFEPDSGLTVGYLIDSTGDAKLGFAASRAAVDAALAAWSNVPTASLVLADAGTTAPAPFGDCSGNKIVFNDPFNELSHTGCVGTLAIGGYCNTGATRVVNGTTFTRIVIGKVTFNSGLSGCGYWTQCNLAQVATHEIGHTIGLGHSSDTSATMYPTAIFDGRCAGLGSDDIAGVSFIYPQAGAPLIPTFTPAPPPPTRIPTATFTRTWTPTPTATPTPSCVPVSTPKIVIGRLDSLPGDQTVTFQGTVTVPLPPSRSFNPLASGAQLRIVSTAGSVLDLPIPGGSFSNPPRRGWKVNAKGTTWTYLDKTLTPPGGIFKVVIQDRSAVSPGRVKFTARGKNGLYTVPSANLPLKGVIVLDLLGGQCGEATFPGPAPAPKCALNRSGSRLTCK